MIEHAYYSWKWMEGCTWACCCRWLHHLRGYCTRSYCDSKCFRECWTIDLFDLFKNAERVGCCGTRFPSTIYRTSCQRHAVAEIPYPHDCQADPYINCFRITLFLVLLPSCTSRLLRARCLAPKDLLQAATTKQEHHEYMFYPCAKASGNIEITFVIGIISPEHFSVAMS